MAVPTLDTPSTSTTDTDAGGTPYDFSVNAPGDYSDGVLMIAVITTENRTIDSVPSGWTLITSAVVAASHLYVYYKVASSESGGAYTWSANGGGEVIACIIPVLGAEDPSVTPIVEQVDNDGGDESGTADAPAITPTDDDSLILHCCSDRRAGTISGPAGENETVYVQASSSTLRVTDDTGGTGGVLTVDFSFTPTWHTDMMTITLAIAPTTAGGTILPQVVSGYYGSNA